MRTEEEIRNQIENALSDLHGLIPRDQLAKTIGYSRGSIANMDSAGTGICNPLRMGNRVLYDKQSVIDWLVSRTKHHES